MKKLIAIFISIALFLTLSFAGCTQEASPSEEEAVKEEITEGASNEEVEEETKSEEEVVKETEESVKELEIDMDKVKFWEAIIEGEKSYDITDKVLDYPFEEMNILSEFIDNEITYDEEITRFWKLANRVQDDFFLVEMMIGGRLKERGIEEPDEEMQEIINLIVEWADKTEKTYSYYAKYLETDQAEYDFKVDELKEETSDIFTKYLELRSPYMKEYNLYYDIK